MGNKKILLCDDDIIFMKNLKSKILNLSFNNFKIDIVTDNTFSFENSYDVYFLDINMPAVTGFELAKEIHKYYPEALLIFLTFHEEFCMKGYEYKAYRFISKYHLEEMLPKVIYDLRNHFRDLEQYINVKEDNHVILLPIRDIELIISEGNYLNFFKGKKGFLKRMKVKDFISQYTMENFIYTGRGILVNMRHVKRYHVESDEVIMDSGIHVNIGKKYKEQFKKQYIKRDF